MATWIDTATRTGSLVHACKMAGVSLLDVREARRSVPSFNEACRLYDEVVDFLICHKVRGSAAEGDARAQGLYFSRVRELIIGEGDSPSADIVITAEGAEAMIRDALKSRGDDLDLSDDPEPPAADSSSKGKRSSPRKPMAR